MSQAYESRKVLSANAYRLAMSKFTTYESPEHSSRETSKETTPSPKVKRSRTSKESSKQTITLNSYTDEFMSNLIEKVKQNPSLWNKRDPKYSNNIAKNKMWNEMNVVLEPLKGGPVDSHHIFALLVKKYKKEASVVNNRPSGSSPKESSWCHYNSMTFVSSSTDDLSFRSDIGFNSPCISSNNNLESSVSSIGNSNSMQEEEQPGPSTAMPAQVNFVSNFSKEMSKKPEPLYNMNSYKKWQSSDRLGKLMEQTSNLKKMIVGLGNLTKEQEIKSSTSSLISQRLKVIETRMNSLQPTAQRKIFKIIDDMLFEEESSNSNYFLNINHEADEQENWNNPTDASAFQFSDLIVLKPATSNTVNYEQ